MRTILALLLFGSTGALHSQEVSLPDFQAKIAKTYYNYKKERLQEFRCTLQSLLLDKKLSEYGIQGGFSQGLAKSFLGLEYTLVYGTKGLKVTCPEGSSTGNAKNDQALREGKEKARDALEKGLGIWALLSFPAGGGGIDPALETLRVEGEKQGWLMRLRRGEDQAILHFDPSYGVTYADLYLKGQDPFRMAVDYLKTSKGLVLKSCRARYQGDLYQIRTEHIYTRGYWLPSKFTLTKVAKGSKTASLVDTLTFENPVVDR